MKKLLPIVLSLIMIMTTFLTTPSSVKAENSGQHQIYVLDELAAWGGSDGEHYFALNDNTGSQEVFTSYKGLSYDAKSNTITMNNITTKDAWFRLDIHNMGDLKIKVVGNNVLMAFFADETNVTIEGSGTLTLNPAVSYTNDWVQVENEHIFDNPVSISNGTLHIANTVNVNIENGDEGANAMSFYFNEAKTEKQLTEEVFTYGGKVSEKITWDSEVTGGPYYENVRESTPYVYHKFPAGKIYYKENSSEENNYYIISNRGNSYNYGYYYFHKLVERNGSWFETTNRDEMYQYDHGTFYDSDNYELTDISFTEYTDFSSMPETLVKDGYAEAYVAQATDANDPVYTKGGEDYVFFFGNSYYNDSLDPVIPEKPKETRRHYAMMKINKIGDYKYLTYAEDIDVYADEADFEPERTSDGKYIANGTEYDEYWDAHTALYSAYEKRVADRVAAKGYTAKTTYVQREYSYTYYITNNQLKFTKTADSATKDISNYAVSGISTKTYTGKALTQKMTVWEGLTPLKSGTDYLVSYKNNKYVGTATVTIQGIGNYTGTITKTFKITKADNPMKITNKTATVKYAKVKKAKQTVTPLTVSKAQGAVTYKKTSGSAKLTVNSKGKVTVKKKTKKGTYKIKVKVTAKGNANYNSLSKTVTVKVKVK